MRETLESLFSFDSRFWRSLGPLLARPGWLTREYWQGRRASFLPPLRLYLFVSFVFFLTSGLFESGAVIDTTGDPKSNSMVRFSGDFDLEESPDLDWDLEFQDDPALIQWIAQNVVRPAIEQPERTETLYLQRLPLGIFFLVPCFAAWLRLLFRKPERYFVPHLVFALHFHAAAFVFLLLGDVGDAISGSDLGSALSAVVILVYPFLALRRVYRDSRWQTGFKQIVLLVVHGSALSIVMMLLLGLTTMTL